MKIFKKLAALFSEIIKMFVVHLPGETGNNLRCRYWRKRLASLGSGVIIDTGVNFQNPDCIHIADRVWIDKNVMILAGIDRRSREKITLRNKDYHGEPGHVYIGKNIHIGPQSIISGISGGLSIGDNCGFSAGCRVYTLTHHYRSKENPEKQVLFTPMVSDTDQCLVEGPIVIGSNTGITLNSIILPGVTIRENSFVKINSVIMPGSKFTANAVIGGDPAKKIEERFPVCV